MLGTSGVLFYERFEESEIEGIEIEEEVGVYY